MFGWLIAFLFCPFAFSGSSHLPFHVMSFNIKGLPSLVLKSEYNDSRFLLLGRLLKERGAKGEAPDLVLLQEVFSPASRLVLEASGYPHRSYGPGSRSLLGVGSGLVILSRHPVEYEAKVAFGRGVCLSFDCLSNKGAQMVRVRVPGLPKPLEVFNTHLQAGRQDNEVRKKQVAVLLSFFREHHQPGSPVIFAGDFNFRPGLQQASYLLFETSGLAHAGKVCLERGCTDGPDEGWHGFWARAVDHQFYSPQGEVQIVPRQVKRTYKGEVEGAKLSDHPAHEVIYDLRWSPAKGVIPVVGEAAPQPIPR